MATMLQGPDMTTFATTRAGRRLLGTLALGAAVILSACNALLSANDPDIVTSATSATGAIALKNGVIRRVQSFTVGSQGPDAIFPYGGLLADEWVSGDTFEQRNSTDQRLTNVTNSFLADVFRTMQRTRVEGRAAIDGLRAFAPTPVSNIGLVFALTAFAENQIGETYCNGIPFSDVKDGVIAFGSPVTVDSAFKRAINSADSALNNAGGDATVLGLAAIVKARALLNRAQYAAAATAVAAVPIGYAYKVFYSSNTFSNQNYALNTSAARYVLSNLEGGNGLNFRTANDPRIPVVDGGRNAFDSSTPFFYTTIWGQYDPVIMASGIEARLIEAEAALKVDDVATYLAKLNAARQTRTDLPDLADPGTTASRVDLLFRERAFWMFSTGHRLGDLRRLIRQYGRGSETVFPTGVFPKGGNYGPDVNLPISFDELNNPAIPQTPQSQTQSTCIDRNA
jgi:starch-binding outer membrane protein, SusD/RagB family